MAVKKTSIQVSFEIKKALDKIGNKGDTYEEIIARLLEIKNDSKTTRRYVPEARHP